MVLASFGIYFGIAVVFHFEVYLFQLVKINYWLNRNLYVCVCLCGEIQVNWIQFVFVSFVSKLIDSTKWEHNDYVVDNEWLNYTQSGLVTFPFVLDHCNLKNTLTAAFNFALMSFIQMCIQTNIVLNFMNVNSCTK